MTLTPTQRAGLLRLGDVIIPGDGELPSFSQSGVADHADRMLDWMYEADRSALLLLLTTVSKMPRPAIKALVLSTELGPRAARRRATHGQPRRQGRHPQPLLLWGGCRRSRACGLGL